MGVASASQDLNNTLEIADAYSPDNVQTLDDIESDSLQISDMENLTAENEDDALSDTGEYLDVSDAYAYLNSFRTEEGVWQWNPDDLTKTYFNTNDTIWLKPMERDVELENAAKVRAMELVEVYDHIRPDGTYFYTLLPDDLIAMGENIAMGLFTAEGVTEAWKETYEPYDWQGHRRNMLYAQFNRVGIAAYRLNGITYWVQDFGCRYDPRPVENTDVFSVENNNTKTPSFKIEMPVYATGDFIVHINGKEILRKSMFQGKSEIIIYGLKAGTYEVETVYGGDYNYESFNKTFKVTATGDDSPISSFTYLNTLVKMAGDEAKLEKDYVFDAEMDSSFIEGIIIPEYMTIDGQGHTIDAKGLARIFYSFESVTLKNIRLINGAVDNYGGALLSYSHTFIENCTFINNTAKINGGAVYSVGQIHAYPSNTFSNNSAQRNGGAMFGEAAVMVKDSTLTNNQAGNLGGAVFAQGSLNTENNYYEKNTNVQVYSYITVYGNGNSWDDEYSLIFANATRDYGIVNLNADLTATQTVIINASNVIINGNGHSINASGKTRIFYVTGNNLTIINITLIAGYSIGEGGAIFGGDCDITVMNAVFKDNQAETGAAISTNKGNIAVSDSRFEDNSANAGGGLFSDEGNLTVIDSFFKNNDAPYYGGGALYSGAMINVTGSTFIESDSTQYGGAIFTLNKVYIRDSVFENNTSNRGGAFHSTGGADIINSEFKDNSATANGGAFSTNGDMLISGSNFTDNAAGNLGGVIYASDGTASVSSTAFKNNRAGVYGGAIYSKGNIVLEKSSFVSNCAENMTKNIALTTGVLSVDDETTYDSPLMEINSVNLGIISAENITYGQEMLITVNVIDNNAITLNIGSVSTILNGKTYSANLTKGKATLSIANLNAGTYTVKLTYSYGRQYQNPSTLTFKVSPADTDIEIVNATAEYGGSILFDVTSHSNPINEGSVLITINGNTLKANVKDGIAEIDIPNLGVGDYEANLQYRGVNFKNVSESVTFKIAPADAMIELITDTAGYGESLSVNVTSPGKQINEGSVLICVNEKNYTAGVKNGIAEVDISDLTVGDYNGILHYKSINFRRASEEISFKVTAADASISVNADDLNEGETALINVEVKSGTTAVNEGNVSISIGGKDYICPVKDGRAVIEIPNLDMGTYSGELSFRAINYKNISKAVSFKVTHAKPDLSVSIKNITYGENAVINVNVTVKGKSVDEGFISATVGNLTIMTSVTEGKAALTVPKLNVGTYDVNVSYVGAENYSDASATSQFCVAIKTVAITASDKTYVINYNGKYSVTVQNVVGENVRFIFNGKDIGFATTDENGVASITLTSKVLKNVKAGKKNLEIKLESRNYKAGKTVKITVNKENTKITAKAKTFKANAKTKKYAITLKAGKNAVSKVTVNLKIKGKTYKATTNSKGTATFKIKLTKKGTYTSKVTFNGNSYYNKSTKSVKIKLK